MQYKSFSPNLQIPVIGLGTWWIGGFMEADYSKDEESIDTIQSAIQMGYTHIDIAEIYGNWHTEELIGKSIQWINRSEVLITDKVSKHHLKYDDVIFAFSKSLERLRTDYIDIYLIHAPNPLIPIEETMNALDHLVEKNMIRYIGVSNFSVFQLQEAQKYTKNRIIVNQIPYSLATRNTDYKWACQNMESQIIPYCQNQDIWVMAYRPIERWFLLQENSTLDSLSLKYGKTKSQIALNWLISKANIVTLIKSESISHLEENLWALWWNLERDDIELLDVIEFKDSLI